MGDVNYDDEPETVDEQPRKPRRKPSDRRVNNTALVRSAGNLFDPLEGAKGEIAFIKTLYEDLFGEDEVSIARLEQSDASEQRFRELAPQCFQLHLATHGFFASPAKQSALNTHHDDEQRGRMFSDR